MSMSYAAQKDFGQSHTASHAAQGLKVECETDFARVENRWAALNEAPGALPFQRSNWLRGWYRTLGQQSHVKPLLLTLSDASKGIDLLALPLCLHIRNGLKIISFADLGFTDYNAPLMGASFLMRDDSAETMLSALLAHLPQADVLELEKMPKFIGSDENPLAHLSTSPSKFRGNILDVPNSWDEWHYGLERTNRKELERSWRVFNKFPNALFKRITDQSEAIAVFAQLKRMQAQRILKSGLEYQLDTPVIDQFYDDVLFNGLATGEVILTGLMIEGEVVAALMGLTHGPHYAMVRLGTGDERWKSCSPGKLIIERTMRHLHDQGFRKFDFTIGDYAYKRRFRVTQIDLYDYRHALSLKGQAYLSLLSMKSALKASPLARRSLESVKTIFKKPNPAPAPSGGEI
ncbi:MAG: GNAT family N-acetyltransferase [Alphaproteobacteria bacterium]|nr:GNAT family N-acetyltransferase [Alphaproteobacteria bacterium]